MRKLLDTLVLILLLLGPAVVLTCVRQDEPQAQEHERLAMHHKELVEKPIANVIKLRP